MRSDARIEDVLHTLSDSEEYVRSVVASFLSHQFAPDEAVVRLGVSGRGTAPHYSIEQGFVTEIVERIGPVRAHERRAVFHGKSHKPILEDQWKGISWSSAAMSFAEVRTILGQLRASRKVH